MGKSIIDVDEVFEDTLDLKEAVSKLQVAQPAPVTTVVDVSKIKACPRCAKPLQPAIAISGSASESFLECPDCGTLINTFVATDYQAEFLRRPERYKMTAGGFGFGKSRVDIEDVIKHVLLIPNARVAVTARTYPALDATFVKDFYSKFPMKLVESKNESKHEIRLTNGAEILLRSFDDPKKLKSLNLTMAVIVEASDNPEAGFDMLQSRIRNVAAMVPEYNSKGDVVKYTDPRTGELKIKYAYDARHINLETNPDSGWVKKFLLDSKVVQFFGDAYNEGYRFNEDPDPEKYSQVVSTSANPHLPPTYEEEQTRGKSKAYVQQMYKGSFNFSTNLVFPNFGTVIKPPHPLPREFDEYGRRRLFYAVGLDYGISDPTHVIFSAFSLDTKKLYVFAEYRVNNSDVKTIAKGYRKAYKENGTNMQGLLMLPRFDGRSYNKRESDLYTIGGMFEAEGLYFEPSFAKHEPRILKLNALINHEQIEIFSTCEFLIEEGLNYKFALNRQGEPTKKPKDGKDHGITALEFIVVELPHNLHELRLSAFLPEGTEIKHDTTFDKPKRKDPVWDPLKEERNERRDYGFFNNPTHRGNSSGGGHHSIHYENADEDDRDNYHDLRGDGELGAYIPGRKN